MPTWSLPPLHPVDPSPHDWLFDHWTPAKTWNWLRAGHLDPQDQALLSRLVIHALQDLGIAGSHLPSVWLLRPIKDFVDPWCLPFVQLPANPTEVWPSDSSQIAETSVGLLAALIANGWNAFEPFLSFKVGGQTTLRPAWGIEVVMGSIGKHHLSNQWRVSLIDQMMRTSFRPSISELSTRRVCQTKKGAEPVLWGQAALRYRNPSALRVCLDYGLPFKFGDGWSEHMTEEEKIMWERCVLNQQTVESDLTVLSHRPRL